MANVIKINRAPVLTLWAAVVAEYLGFDWEEALTLGRAMAGLNAYSKGVSLGLYQLTPEAERKRHRKLQEGEVFRVDLLHRAVPSVQTPEGLRALSKERPISPESVELYLEGKFGDHLDDARKAMERLERSWSTEELARQAYHLYEQFRLSIPAGVPRGAAQLLPRPPRSGRGCRVCGLLNQQPLGQESVPGMRDGA